MTGIVSDPNHSHEALQVVWLVNDEVICDHTTPLEDGTTNCDTVFSSEDSQVELIVTNPDGHSGNAAISINVQPTEAPTDHHQPADGWKLVLQQSTHSLQATVTDTEDSPDDLVVAWNSDLDGGLDDLGSTPESDGYTGGTIELSEEIMSSP